MDFDSGRFRVNQFLVQYVCHANICNFLENFGSDMVWFGSIWVSGPLLGEPISDAGSGRDLDCLVRILDPGSILSNLSQV